MVKVFPVWIMLFQNGVLMERWYLVVNGHLDRSSIFPKKTAINVGNRVRCWRSPVLLPNLISVQYSAYFPSHSGTCFSLVVRAVFSLSSLFAFFLGRCAKWTVPAFFSIDIGTLSGLSIPYGIDDSLWIKGVDATLRYVHKTAIHYLWKKLKYLCTSSKPESGSGCRCECASYFHPQIGTQSLGLLLLSLSLEI